MKKIFISTYPFGKICNQTLKNLTKLGIDYKLNQLNRKITSEELINHVKDIDVLVAGTENITEEVLIKALKLKLISRVGIGLDNIDFNLCRKYKVRVTYTPDAPTMAVAELIVGMILDLLRKITEVNQHLKQGKWNRYIGELVRNKTVGIFGLGRIGKSLVHLLSSFGVKFLAYDINPDIVFCRLHQIKLVTKEQVITNSDIISINLPLTPRTYNFITLKDFKKMHKNSILINCSRGPIVNEQDLYHALKKNIIKGAGIDVFCTEPYYGNLTQLDNCILTAHIGAATRVTRIDMEKQSIDEVIRFLQNKNLKNEVFSN